MTYIIHFEYYNTFSFRWMADTFDNDGNGYTEKEKDDIITQLKDDVNFRKIEVIERG